MKLTLKYLIGHARLKAVRARLSCRVKECWSSKESPSVLRATGVWQEIMAARIAMDGVNTRALPAWVWKSNGLLGVEEPQGRDSRSTYGCLILFQFNLEK